MCKFFYIYIYIYALLIMRDSCSRLCNTAEQKAMSNDKNHCISYDTVFRETLEIQLDDRDYSLR